MIAMGIDVGGTNLRVGAVNSAGDLILSFREPTPQGSDPLALVDMICALVQTVQAEITEPIMGLGLGWPGAVNRELGLVLQTPNILGFKDYPLQNELERRLQIPTRIENDAKCAGLAEKKFGAAKEFKEFILLTFGTGIGGVIFAHSNLVQGRSGIAGEIGHMCLYPGGLPCSCGSRGCFEQYASAKALERRAQQILGENISAREILTKSLTNSEARRCIQEYISDLGVGVGSIMNIFNPEAIIFSGGLFTTGGGTILDELKIELSKQGFQTIKKDVHLLASALEGKAGIIGAACLGFPLTAIERDR
jgi:glucokinase